MATCETTIGKKREEALSVLFDTVKLLDENNIIYHLEGGTLLGLIREGDLLPWDHDLDISIMSADAALIEKILPSLLYKGHKVSSRSFLSNKYVFKQGEKRIFKVKRWASYVKSVIFFKGSKPVALDVFVKYSDELNTYWEANKKVMKVPKSHYASYETVMFLDYPFKVPNDPKGYLALKYGDWEVPVKEWNCSKDEGTVIGDI